MKQIEFCPSCHERLPPVSDAFCTHCHESLQTTQNQEIRADMPFDKKHDAKQNHRRVDMNPKLSQPVSNVVDWFFSILILGIAGAVIVFGTAHVEKKYPSTGDSYYSKLNIPTRDEIQRNQQEIKKRVRERLKGFVSKRPEPPPYRNEILREYNKYREGYLPTIPFKPTFEPKVEPRSKNKGKKTLFGSSSK